MKKITLYNLLSITASLLCIYTVASEHPTSTHSNRRSSVDLLNAVARGDEAEVVSLLINGASLSYQSLYGKTPLILAAHNGHTEIVALLLAANANVNFQYRGSWTALARAAYQGHRHIVSQLLDANANIDQIVFVRRPYRGAIYDAYGSRQRLPRLLLQNRPRYFKTTALHCAAQNGHDEAAHLLLAAGADKEHSDGYKRTPLLVAAQYRHTAIAQLLIDAGVDLNVQDLQGNTPLHHAVMCQNHATVQGLIQAGASLNIANEQGETPLMLAAWNQSRLILKTLLRCGAHIPTTTIDVTDRFTLALYIEIEHRRSKMLKKYIDNIETTYNIPRDITRIICTMADFAPDDMPPVPGSSKSLKKGKLRLRQPSMCTIL